MNDEQISQRLRHRRHQLQLQSSSSSINSNTLQRLFNTNLLSNALSIACEIPVEETNIMSFLDLREFLMTACTVVVLLTLLNALQGTLTKGFNRINRLISGKKKEQYSN